MKPASSEIFDWAKKTPAYSGETGVTFCDSGRTCSPGNWKSWGKQATKERPQNSHQFPGPKDQGFPRTQVTKQPHSKPNQKGKGYPQPGSTMNRTGTPHQPAPGRSLFLLRHVGDRRGDPATLIRGCNGSELEPNANAWLLSHHLRMTFKDMANHTLKGQTPNRTWLRGITIFRKLCDSYAVTPAECIGEFEGRTVG